MYFYIPSAMIIPTWLIVLVILYPLYLLLFDKCWDRLWDPFRVPPEGHVYLFRRNDGIYKVGRSINLQERLYHLNRGTEHGFSLIRAWAVPNIKAYETCALKLTQRYKYTKEKGRELRKMSAREARAFIFVFTVICEKSARIQQVGFIPPRSDLWPWTSTATGGGDRC